MERVTEEVACGNPNKLQITNTTEEKWVDLEESPTSSPSPSPSRCPSLSPPGMARSGGPPADTATGSEDVEDVNVSTGRAGDTTHRTTRICTAKEGRKYLEDVVEGLLSYVIIRIKMLINWASLPLLIYTS